MTRKRILNSAFVLVALGTTALVARHFAHTGWPLRDANLWLTIAQAFAGPPGEGREARGG